MDNEHQPPDTNSQHTTNLYHIDNKIEFDHQKCLLRSLIDDSTFTLLAASSECFHALLMNHGQLVNKSKLIYEGWEKYGLHVSDNTFYQNILVLRKGLRTCGIDYEVIRTLPRKGLIIPDAIQVTEVSPQLPERKDISLVENDPEHIAEGSEDSQTEDDFHTFTPVQNDSHVPQDSTLETSSTDAAHFPEDDLLPNDTSDNPLRQTESQKINEESPKKSQDSLLAIRKLFTRRSMAMLLLVILAVGSLLYFIDTVYNPGNSYFTHYKRSNVEQGCNIYVSEKALPGLNVKKFLLDNEIKCSNRETLYISAHEFIARKSVLKCSKPFGSDSKDNPCISYYIMDGEYDE